jgi:hypothetical protein
VLAIEQERSGNENDEFCQANGRVRYGSMPFLNVGDLRDTHERSVRGNQCWRMRVE